MNYLQCSKQELEQEYSKKTAKLEKEYSEKLKAEIDRITAELRIQLTEEITITSRRPLSRALLALRRRRSISSFIERSFSMYVSV